MVSVGFFSLRRLEHRRQRDWFHRRRRRLLMKRRHHRRTPTIKRRRRRRITVHELRTVWVLPTQRDRHPPVIYRPQFLHRQPLNLLPIASHGFSHTSCQSLAVEAS
ncbi:hypothetical protein SAICODRAFT_101458 [Saitoella complicata NRRL Y-17804]|uniref:uncharacterized protein n=1 Tax=Saitoella complicata (strain BCRC 22490 / CBS 7301 / JCM 7358 / NBRC 10748 / NRRL Y-17804) TaxID=698492 RepID=UPI000867EF28|nr:uncharacterized protein SAICODRAFT_101458 [Saitoella complicata NRRL Y-17804]ODQ56113.1 hypothetical protein SAICODRAFT_101458 [Saitoella complicata NRRL Y-17804]